MSSPLKTIRPASGWWIPESKLNSVDLPAPFGPIRQRSSPAATARFSSSTARIPPNALVRPPPEAEARALRASSRRLPSSAPPQSVQRHHDARGKEQHRRQQQRAHDEEGVLPSADSQGVRQPFQRYGGEGDGNQAAPAAHRGPDHRERRGVE